MTPIAPIAERIAKRIVSALEAGKLPRINSDVIRAAISYEKIGHLDSQQREQLEEMTTRRLVEKVS